MKTLFAAADTDGSESTRGIILLTALAKSVLRSLRETSLALAMALVAFAVCEAQIPTKTKTIFKLFPVDATCSCIDARSETATIKGEKITVKNKVYQVFTDKRTKAELFRVVIGEGISTLWNYGISWEGELSGNGKLDYAWYGGDDTADVMYVFLSSEHGFRRLDIYKTFQREWVRTFHTAAPEFSDIDREYALINLRFLRDAAGSSLLADIHSTADTQKGPRRLQVRSSNFVFSD